MITTVLVFLIVGRILFGGFFIMNGYSHFRHLGSMTGYATSKNVPMPKVAVIVTGLMLILGGVGVILGGDMVMVYALMTLVVFLLVTTFMMHRYWENTDPMQRMGERVNFMKNIALLGSVLMLFAMPMPWIWDIARLIGML